MRQGFQPLTDGLTDRLTDEVRSSLLRNSYKKLEDDKASG